MTLSESLRDEPIGTIILEKLIDGQPMRWIKVSQGNAYPGIPNSKKRFWNGQGDARPHYQCRECNSFVLNIECRFSPNGIAVCNRCYDRGNWSKPKVQVYDDPILKIMNGRMGIKLICSKVEGGMRIKDCELALEVLKNKGQVSFKAGYWEKVK